MGTPTLRSALEKPLGSRPEELALSWWSMPLVLRGKSTCSLCGLVLESDQIVGLPPVLPPDHPLWRFSDSAMHESCYENWRHRDYFKSVLRKRGELWYDRRYGKKRHPRFGHGCVFAVKPRFQNHSPILAMMP